MLTPNTSESKQIQQAKAKIYKDLEGSIFHDDLFKGELEEVDGKRVVAYNCKRVGRLSRSRALGLLMSFTSTLGRPAYERDFI